MNKPTRFSEDKAILIVSDLEEDNIHLRSFLADSGWTVSNVPSCLEALFMVRDNPPAVVISEEYLPDGDWKHILDIALTLKDPPALIVVSRLANELFWAEVLNFGGYDVLAKPLHAREVLWAVNSALEARVRRSDRSNRLEFAIR